MIIKEHVALDKALLDHIDRQSAVDFARRAFRNAEQNEKNALKEIGAACRALRGRLDITAATLSAKVVGQGYESLKAYINFEDTGEIYTTERNKIIEELNRLATAAEAE